MICAGRFDGRAAVITGGASGLGRETARRIVAEGGRVALWDIDPDWLAEAHKEVGAAHSIVFDVTDREAVERAAAESQAALGRIDVLVNSVGITGATAPVEDYPVESWLSVIDVNLNGIFYSCRAVVPFMLANNYGRIVNVASVAGKEGNPNASAYSASKAGVIGFTKSLGKELATRGVIANSVTPGDLRQPDAGAAAAEPGRLHALEDPDGAPRRRPRDRRHDLLHGLGGMQLHHRRHLRHVGRPDDVLRRRRQQPRREMGRKDAGTAVRRRPRPSVGPEAHPLSLADAAFRRRRAERQRRADRHRLSARRLSRRGRRLERRRASSMSMPAPIRRRRSPRPTGCRTWPTTAACRTRSSPSPRSTIPTWKPCSPRTPAAANVRGIRHIVNWHADPSRSYTPRDVTGDAAWARGFGLLSKYGLSFDLQAYPGQFAGLARLIERHPETPVIVNHAGMGDRRSGRLARGHGGAGAACPTSR